jgi:putative thymidine phosphorylase
MKLVVKDMDIATGDVQVVLLNQQDAEQLDLHHMDRLVIRKNNRKTVAVLDIAESKKAVPPGKIGFFEEVLDALHAKDGDVVQISIAEKPESVGYIRKKLDGETLAANELKAIVNDIVGNRLTDIELTSFVAASYTHGMNMKEVAALTKAMTETGQMLNWNKAPIVDIHSIGGVPGNRTTMIVVPILVAAGLTVPKTSSRAITSPAGTADTMEVLCPVALTPAKLKRIINEVGGFIIWGGSVNLAPADDRIIHVEHPLSIDPEGQMLASIMAKKASVGATHLLMDIPVGKGAKVHTRAQAKHLSRHFAELGHALNIKIKTVITDGSEPVGNGIGPVLEARDALWLLKNDPRAPYDLRERSLKLAAMILEFTCKARKGEGLRLAIRLLNSGAAHGAMARMIEAQGGKEIDPDELAPASLSYVVKAAKTGTVIHVDNVCISKIARLAGAPVDKDAGIFLHKHKGDRVGKGEPIFAIYARSRHKLQNAVIACKKLRGIEIA